MASEVDISNLALAHLGDEATVSSINPPEGSIQAEHCKRFYPVARDAVLEYHPWSFATRRVVLPELAVPTWTWQKAYGKPVNCIRVIAVLPPEAASDAATQDYEMEGGVVYTDVDQATMRYVKRVTDTAQFTPLFTDALAWLLAAYLAGPVMKGDLGAKMAQTCMGAYQTILASAVASDARQRKGHPQNTAPWIAGR